MKGEVHTTYHGDAFEFHYGSTLESLTGRQPAARPGRDHGPLGAPSDQRPRGEPDHRRQDVGQEHRVLYRLGEAAGALDLQRDLGGHDGVEDPRHVHERRDHRRGTVEVDDEGQDRSRPRPPSTETMDTTPRPTPSRARHEGEQDHLQDPRRHRGQDVRRRGLLHAGQQQDRRRRASRPRSTSAWSTRSSWGG